MNMHLLEKHFPLGTFVRLSLKSTNGSTFGTLIDYSEDGLVIQVEDQEGGGKSLVEWSNFETMVGGDTALACVRIANDRYNDRSAKKLTDHLADIRRERANAEEVFEEERR